MSRHKSIAEMLVRCEDGDIIRGWSKDSDPANPQRVHWIVSLDTFTTRRWRTSEVEAFLDGVRETAHERPFRDV